MQQKVSRTLASHQRGIKRPPPFNDLEWARSRLRSFVNFRTPAPFSFKLFRKFRGERDCLRGPYLSHGFVHS